MIINMGDIGKLASNSAPIATTLSNRSSEVSRLSNRCLTPYETISGSSNSQNSRVRIISERGTSSDTLSSQRNISEGRFGYRTNPSALSLQSVDEPYAIHFAASNGNAVRIIDLVKNYGTNINIQDELGRTALQTAILFSKPIVSSLLLSMGVDTNVQDKDGNTAMHYAISTGSYKLAKELIFHKADMNIKNKSGLSPYEMIPYRDDRRFKVFKVSSKQQHKICRYNPFRPPVDPIARPALLFKILNLAKIFRIAMICIFILPRIKYHYSIPCISLSLLSYTILYFSVYTNAKFINNTPHRFSGMSIQELYEKFPNDLVCPYCSIVRNQDTRHCHHCKKCIDGFDHHCIWFNTCIGKK